MQRGLNIYQSSWPPLSPALLLLAAARVYWKSTCRHTEQPAAGSRVPAVRSFARSLTSAILDELYCVRRPRGEDGVLLDVARCQPAASSQPSKPSKSPLKIRPTNLAAECRLRISDRPELRTRVEWPTRPETATTPRLLYSPVGRPTPGDERDNQLARSSRPLAESYHFINILRNRPADRSLRRPLYLLAATRRRRSPPFITPPASQPASRAAGLHALMSGHVELLVSSCWCRARAGRANRAAQLRASINDSCLVISFIYFRAPVAERETETEAETETTLSSAPPKAKGLNASGAARAYARLLLTDNSNADR